MGNEQSYQQQHQQHSNGVHRSATPRPILRRQSMSPSPTTDDADGQLRRSVGFRDQTEDAMRSGRYHQQVQQKTAAVQQNGTVATHVAVATSEHAANNKGPGHRKGRAPPPPPKQEVAPRLPKMDRQTQDEIRNRAQNIANSRPASEIEQRVDQRRKFDMTNFKVELAEAAARVRERQLTAGGSVGGAKETERAAQSRMRLDTFPAAPQMPTRPPIRLFDPSRQDATPETSSNTSPTTSNLLASPPSPPSLQPSPPNLLPQPQQPKHDEPQSQQPQHDAPQPPQTKPKPSAAALKEELKQEILMELLKTVTANPSTEGKIANSADKRSAESEPMSKSLDRQRLVEEIRREVLLSTQPKAEEAERAAAVVTARRQYEEAAAAGYYNPYIPQQPPIMRMQARPQSEFDVYFGNQPHYQPYVQVQHSMPPPPYQAVGIYPQYAGHPPLVAQAPQVYQPQFQYEQTQQTQQHPAVFMRRYGFLTPPSPQQPQWGPVNGYNGTPPPQNGVAYVSGNMQSYHDERHRHHQHQQLPTSSGRNGGSTGGSKRRLQFTDSWKRMTNSLSRAFGGGGAGGDGNSAGVRRRTSVRDATFDKPTGDDGFEFSSRSDSMYDLSGVEMPAEDVDYDDRRRSSKHSSRRLSSSHQGSYGVPEEEIWRDVARASHDSLRISHPSASYSFSVDEDADRHRKEEKEGIQRRRIVQTTAEEESVAEERRTVVTLQQRRRTTAASRGETSVQGQQQPEQQQRSQQEYRIPRAAAGLGQFMQSEQTRF